MTIRTRLSLWYAGIMFVSLLAMGVLSYREFVVEPRNRALRGEEAARDVADDEGDFAETAGTWFGGAAADSAAPWSNASKASRRNGLPITESKPAPSRRCRSGSLL